MANAQLGLAVANSGSASSVSAASDIAAFEHIFRAIHGDIVTYAAYALNDPHVRALYDQSIQAAANELRDAAKSGKISWKQAAVEANQLRNAIMEALRARTSPIGLAKAQALKTQGKALNTLIAEKTIAGFGPNADFNRLAPAQKNQVFAAVVESAGKANLQVTPTWLDYACSAASHYLLHLLSRCTTSSRLRTR